MNRDRLFAMLVPILSVFAWIAITLTIAVVLFGCAPLLGECP